MDAIALTIAGSDPSGGAGLQADLKTFHQHAVYGMSVVTLVTVQNTRAVSEVQQMETEFVIRQLQAVLEDLPPAAAKTGALGNAATIRALAERVPDFPFPLIVDPVMVSKHGDPLLDEQSSVVLRDELVPQAYLVTPNVHEAAALAGHPVDDLHSMEQAARTIAARGAGNVLIKGGSLEGPAIDLLWTPSGTQQLSAARHSTRHTHGSGCVFSAAIVARLARGDSLAAAVARAKEFVNDAIRTAPGIGRGFGPLNMLAPATDCEITTARHTASQRTDYTEE